MLEREIDSVESITHISSDLLLHSGVESNVVFFQKLNYININFCSYLFAEVMVSTVEYALFTHNCNADCDLVGCTSTRLPIHHIVYRTISFRE